ncbi:hypothetical protein EYF80_041921 [Liparis tanakae]|uniref:Uncharacterized protein n=1 Tax=Liparis tanakae TaxID=230148 RepID=A0A4Z2G3W1_9TELE|nr:hypothetical protein EYF80_041921 [Liparis tanakae]
MQRGAGPMLRVERRPSLTLRPPLYRPVNAEQSFLLDVALLDPLLVQVLDELVSLHPVDERADVAAVAEERPASQVQGASCRTQGDKETRRQGDNGLKVSTSRKKATGSERRRTAAVLCLERPPLGRKTSQEAAAGGADVDFVLKTDGRRRGDEGRPYRE